jgi:hypothetical protein
MAKTVNSRAAIRLISITPYCSKQNFLKNAQQDSKARWGEVLYAPPNDAYIQSSIKLAEIISFFAYVPLFIRLNEIVWMCRPV